MHTLTDMKGHLDKLNSEIRGSIELIGKAAGRRNMPVFIVGGFVRDMLLGVENLDLDIVVEGDGIVLAQDLAALLGGHVISHRRFGTATVAAGPHNKFDIATARRETYPRPGSLPEVTPGGIDEDLARRDFTINAMAVSIGTRDFGRFLDLFEGLADLRARRVRILHGLSFLDDPTRMLRAIRFEQRYGFRIEAGTLQRLEEAMRAEAFGNVNAQRLRDELILLLKEKHPLRCLKRMQELTGLGFISKGLSLSKDTGGLLRSVESEINRFRLRYPRRRKLDAWLMYFMSMIDGLGMTETKALCAGFRFCKGDEKRILSYKTIGKDCIRQLGDERISGRCLFGLLEPLSYEVILMIKAKSARKACGGNIEKFFKTYHGTRVGVSGEDLKKLGLTPGPHFQKIFARVLDARLDGEVRTKTQELALIKKLLRDS